MCLCTVFAMTSKIRKKGKNFKINRKGGRLKKSIDLKIFRFTGRLGRSAAIVIRIFLSYNFLFTKASIFGLPIPLLPGDSMAQDYSIKKSRPWIGANSQSVLRNDVTLYALAR